MTQESSPFVGKMTKEATTVIGNRTMPRTPSPIKTVPTTTEKRMTNPKTTPTRSLPTVVPPVVSPPNDMRRSGRLLGWQSAWPKGWAHEVVKAGLRWPWVGSKPLRLRLSKHLPRVSESVSKKVEDRLKNDVIQEEKRKVMSIGFFVVRFANLKFGRIGASKFKSGAMGGYIFQFFIWAHLGAFGREWAHDP